MNPSCSFSESESDLTAIYVKTHKECGSGHLRISSDADNIQTVYTVWEGNTQYTSNMQII